MNTYSYKLRSSDAGATIPTPQYAYFFNDSAPQDQKHTCFIRFNIVSDLQPPVFQYYRLTNFYQNNRRYVQSLDSAQLQGQDRDASSLSNSNCKPLAVTSDGKVIYPCGLIANSKFNGKPRICVDDKMVSLRIVDTILGFRPTSDSSGSSDYNFTQSGIAWPGEAKKYSSTSGYVGKLNEIVPPPNWALMYPNNYTDDNPPPNLQEDEHFQNWMRTAGLPTFSKLYGRNDTSTLSAGQYQVQIFYSELPLMTCPRHRSHALLDFPVQGYKGTKSLVISTVSWIGGKNPFLGWAYVAAAAVFVLLAVAGTIRHLVRPRSVQPSVIQTIVSTMFLGGSVI